MHIRTNVAASLNDIQAIKAGLVNVVARKGHGADLAWHLAYDPQFSEPPLERLNRIQGEMGRLAQSARKNKRVDWHASSIYWMAYRTLASTNVGAETRHYGLMVGLHADRDYIKKSRVSKAAQHLNQLSTVTLALRPNLIGPNVIAHQLSSHGQARQGH